MRELILFIATSDDGYIAKSDGSIDWLTSLSFSEGEDGGFHSMYESIDTIVMGRKTFEHVMDLSGGIYPHQDLNTILVTTDLNYPLELHVHGTAVTLWSGEVVEQVRRLKEEDGKAIWLCGGASIINQLMHAKLVDRLIITIAPVSLGEGIPLWDADSLLGLHVWKSISERVFDGCRQITYIKEHEHE